MAKNRKLRTVPEVVTAFGGPKATAEWAGVGVSAVSNWTTRSFIPPGWHYRMARHFEAKGCEIDPVVFGEEPESEGRRRVPAERRVA